MRLIYAIAPVLMTATGPCTELDKLTGHAIPTAQQQWEGEPNGYGVYFAPAQPGAGGGQLHQAPAMSREGLEWVRSLGGAVDDQGRYAVPIPASQVYGVPVGDGSYLHPPAWDGNGDFQIRLNVEGGMVTGQDFYFNKGE